MAKNEFSLMTPEQRRENGRKGGIASGEAKRKKKAMRETLDVLLSMRMKNGKFADIESITSFAALKGKNISVQEAMIISMLQRAMKGDVKAAEWVRDTAGQKPVDNANVNMNLPVFFEGEDDLEE
ncbi:MAG: hypothetical protein J6U74_05410 [Clostridia bacterium]|nr:hypothetical protein [Clostridia bacterium]MBO7326930.1 hypothetical protein [Clostridia bacterium]